MLSLYKVIGSFEAVAFSFTNLLFSLSRFSLLSSGHFLSCLPPFCSNSSKKKKQKNKRKTSRKYNYLRFERNGKHKGIEDCDLLSYLRTQLTVFVGGVCLRSKKIFFMTVFSKQFFTSRRH